MPIPSLIINMTKNLIPTKKKVEEEEEEKKKLISSWQSIIKDNGHLLQDENDL